MPPPDVTLLLNRAKQGDRDAEAEILQLLYRQLKGIAVSQLRRERDGHTLQPTALVHEAYLALAGSQITEWTDRTHFLAMASRAMRHILVDYARARNAVRRGGNQVKVDFTFTLASQQPRIDDVLVLNNALEKLAATDERKAQVVELRFFGGLTEAEIASVLGVSERTVKRDWVCGRAWLHGELGRVHE